MLKGFEPYGLEVPKEKLIPESTRAKKPEC